LFSPRNGSNAPPTRTFISNFFRRSSAEFARKVVVLAFSHGGIKVDDVQQGYSLNFLRRPKTSATASSRFDMNQLDCLPALQVDAGNQHGKRTSTLRLDRNSFSVRIDCTAFVKDDAAKAASAAPS